MNKVLIISTSINSSGGISSYIYAIKSTYIWQKWNCVLIPTHIDKTITLRICFFAYGFIKFIFNIFRAKIVHIHLSWEHSMLRKLPFIIISRIFKKKIVIHLHSGAEPIIYSRYKKQYQYIFNHADITILLSKSILDELFKHFSFSKTIVIYNPCPSLIKINELQKKNQILFAGALVEKKGIYDLIKSFSNVSKKFPDWKLVIAGKGEIDKVNITISNLNLMKKIIYLGWVSDSEKKTVFSESRIFCLPSYSEGFPMSVVEAWAYGLPVITTPVGGLIDVLENDKNALVFLPGDVVSLTVQLERLMSDRKLRRKLSEQSKKLCLNEFKIQNITKQIDELYNSLLA